MDDFDRLLRALATAALALASMVGDRLSPEIRDVARAVHEFMEEK